MGKKIKRLRRMSAQVLEDDRPIYIKRYLNGEEIIKRIDNYRLLQSYNSIVAIYDYDKVYLLPRYDYSVTTWKHLHAFIQDFTGNIDLTANDMRMAALQGDYNYHFADSFSFYGSTWKKF